MAPSYTQTLLSPAELAYLHTSLSLTPPIRPDSRLPTQFRPLIAETDILPGTNGSARICFADGTEAIVGIKAEVEKSAQKAIGVQEELQLRESLEHDDAKMGGTEETRQDAVLGKKGAGENSWVEMTIEIPGFRDDDALPVFLAAMLNEALLATGELVDKLWINSRWHWKLYIDILLLSLPLSYPIPLLSLTTHLALLSTHLPALKSELDEDPLFNDDWAAAVPLYPRSTPTGTTHTATSPAYTTRPPVTLLVAAVGLNIFFDPTREELAVADAVLAVSLSVSSSLPASDSTNNKRSKLQILSIRTIDPPARMTTPGVPDTQNSATGGGVRDGGMKGSGEEGVWRPPRGGMKRALVSMVVEMCLMRGGVGEEVLAGLEGVDVG